MPLESSQNGGTEETWLQLSFLNDLGLVPKEDVHKGVVMLSCSAAGGPLGSTKLEQPLFSCEAHA